MSWVERVFEARSKGWLTQEEAWQIMLDAREAPDPGVLVDRVLRGLAAAYRPPAAVPEAVPEEVVIEDLPPAE